MRKALFLILLFQSYLSNAQKGIIEGYINDGETRSPLIGASINVDNKGENSDQFGQFRLTNINPGNYELVATYIGYKTEVIPVEVKENLTSIVSVTMRKASLDLSEIKLNGRRNTGLNTLNAVDIMLRPIKSSQDMLRLVPGLFIAQHAGGGKAEQIFLRGYDIDHGTDIAVTVDGMPVNMVSHAHGQGYADLHFVIPETVEKVNFDKGPYFTNKGNLATAGYVDFQTNEFLKENSIKLEAGQFNTKRLVGMMNLFKKETEKNRQQFYIASEYFTSDGYFDNPQNFHRFNIMGKYNAWFGNQSQLTIIASTFNSKWNASGQVPDRAVKDGTISRFGSIDNSEGGNTGRSNFSIRFAGQLKNNWKTTNQIYFTRYNFNLYSDFTFFLHDSVNGDEINQREKRNLFGYTSSASKSWLLGNKNAHTEFGGGFRQDNIIGIELATAVKRTKTGTLQKGDIKETNGFLYWNQNIDLSNQFSINGGIRFDMFRFAYRDILAGNQSFNHQQRSIVSPKLNLVFTPSSTFKIYLNNGIGFHSNDTRVILNNSAKDILPKVYGTDLGIILKPAKRLIIKTVLWHLLSEQEFVYVGDEGIIEAGGQTRRLGIEMSARYQFNKWLFADLDLNYTKARSVKEAKGENYIPLAPVFTSIAGLSAKFKNGFSGSLRYRYLADRPADELNTIKATGYFITDMVIEYNSKRFDLSISAENIFDTEWKEAQFNTTTRLQSETDPVTEIHYTPGTPRFIKAGIRYKF